MSEFVSLGMNESRISESIFWGKMYEITGILGFKKVWGLPLYYPVFHTWIENRFGKYVGDVRTGLYLYERGIIDPELAPVNPGMEQHRTCSIGWCEREQKWYGWSHRAICGFGIGDVVKEGDCCASSGYTEECLKDHPDWDESLPIGFTANTLDDAKRMAIAFAGSVG
jgi:hypothetical protein